jgi:hypothetical protein
VSLHTCGCRTYRFTKLDGKLSPVHVWSEISLIWRVHALVQVNIYLSSSMTGCSWKLSCAQGAQSTERLLMYTHHIVPRLILHYHFLLIARQTRRPEHRLLHRLFIDATWNCGILSVLTMYAQSFVPTWECESAVFTWCEFFLLTPEGPCQRGTKATLQFYGKNQTRVTTHILPSWSWFFFPSKHLVGEKLDKSLEPRKPLMTGMPNWNKERPKVFLKSVPGDSHDSGQSLIMRFFL